MATSIQLLAAFILFFVSIANAYSSLAHWITTSDYLENNKFKDLTSNGNDPIQSSSGKGSITSGVTCASFKTSGTETYYGRVANLGSYTELGISVWLNIPSSVQNMVPLWTSSSTGYKIYLINVSPTQTDFKVSSTSASFVLSRDKWIFVVLYFHQRTGGAWDAYAISPGQTTRQITDGNPPGNYLGFGTDGVAYYYEIQVFTKAEISGYVVTLSDKNSATYIATTTTCPAACSDYCHPEIGCLSTTDCNCPSLCNCLAGSGLCASCKDSTYGADTQCKCKKHFILDNSDNCVFSNFYTDLPLHCVDGTSKTACTQCEAKYFLYDDGTSTICLGNFYLGCDSCETCNASPNCYKCADSIVQDGSTCRVDSIGYQLSFDFPNIVFDFAHSLAKNLKISHLSAKTEANQDISTTNWDISGFSTPKQYQIVTDLTETQLPINIDFYFEQA